MLNTAMTNKTCFNKTAIRLAATAALYFLVQIPSHAGVYKWTDENGEVHYGDRPGNTDATTVTIRQNETTSPRAIKSAEEGEKDNAKDDKADPKAAEPKKQVEESLSKKEKQRLCQEGKNDYAVISSRGRMREINAKGEYIYLSEPQRQQRLTAAKKKQQKYCR